MQADHGSTFHFDEFTLDLSRAALTRDGALIELRPKTFDVLTYLVRHPERLISKDDLIAAVWAGTVVTDDSLVQCVREIRMALGDSAQELVRTIPRRGYLLNRAVRMESDATVVRLPRSPAEIAAARTDKAGDNHGKARPPVRPYGVILGAIITVTLMAVAGWMVIGNGTRSQSGAPAPLSLVVLPLANLSGDPNDDLLVDSITRDLSLDLSRIPESFIISPNTALKFKDQRVDAKSIGEELKVRYVMEGGVRTAADRVVLNVALVEAQSRRQVWADRFESERAEMSSLQREVTSRLARRLHLKLLEAEATRGARERPNNPMAHDLVMRGWVLQYRERPESVAQARDLFQRAIELEPQSVSAWAGLATSYHTDVANRWLNHRNGATRGEWVKRQIEAASKAYALDPEHPLANHEMGVALFFQGKIAEALERFRKEVSINRNDPHAQLWLGVALSSMGTPELAIAPIQESIRLSPRDAKSYNFYNVLSFVFTHLGRFDEALEAASKGVAIWPDAFLGQAALAASAAHVGNVGLARTAAQEMQRLNPGYTVTQFRTDEARALPQFLAQREAFYQGLLKAGFPP